MREGWKYKRLEDVCSIDYGTRVVQKKNKGTKYYVYGGGGATFMIDSYNREDCFIISRFAMSPKCTRFVKGKFFLNDSGLSVSTKIPTLSQDFVDKVLLANNDTIYSFGKGMAQRNLDIPSFRNLVIPIPPLPEQERIVTELDLLTSIIDKQKAQLGELNTLAQSIFYNMFGDPIENEKGFPFSSIGDLASDVAYGTSKPSSDVGKYVYLRMNNITYGGEIDLNNIKYIDVSEEEFAKYSVQEGDVLFNRTNSADLVGKTTWFHGLPPMIIAGYIIRVRLKPILLSVYLSSFMNTPEVKKLLKVMGKGAVNQSNINSKELKSIVIPVPPLALQESFARKIQSIESQKESIHRSIAETQKLFDYTMDKYFG